MANPRIADLLLFVFLAVFAASSNASITWDWSFGSNAGQFTTTGTAIGTVASPDTYAITDFSVTSSGTGATVGSLSGGEYGSDLLDTTLPYSLVWDGAVVTSWIHSGGNSFKWLVFDDLSNANAFFFGFETGNVNTPMQATYYLDSLTSSAPSFDLSINVSSIAPIPEPEIYALMGIGLGLMGWVGRRRKLQAA